LELIRLEDVSFVYALGKAPALEHISLDIVEGEFLVLCGPSNSGKTTLIRHLKQEIAPSGALRGRLIRGLPSEDIGMVFHNPDIQMTGDSVLQNLAFGMENLGFDQRTMKKRMSETVSFFGVEDLLHRSVTRLSGGEKQLIALCSVMMTRPRLILLDEPISQLDPIAARNFLDMLRRLHEEFGLSIVLAEHRLDDVLAPADRLVLMDGGRAVCQGRPREVLASIWHGPHRALAPELSRASLGIGGGLEENVALTAGAFKAMLATQWDSRRQANGLAFEKRIKSQLARIPALPSKSRGALVLSRVVFQYNKDSAPVLRDLSLSVPEGALMCLLGGNGSGKSTLLKLAAGILKPYMGSIRKTDGPIGYMPQNLGAYFVMDTVRAELAAKGDSALLRRLTDIWDLAPLMERHPWDLSGGEQQKVAFASILLRKPRLILLDEPTKGLDPWAKMKMAELLEQAQATALIATHDLEFAARYAHQNAMLFDGEIAFCAHPRIFFSENRYYTTHINKAIRQFCPQAMFYEDVMELWAEE
jgi:energy-coupling factor transport system ATP-binding protein